MLLLVLTMICTFVSQLLFILFYLLFSGNIQQGLSAIQDLQQANSKSFLYGSLLTGSIGTFLLPSLLLQKMERKQVSYFPQQKQEFALYLLLIFLFMLFSSPIMEGISVWNQKLSLPESLKSLEIWMFDKEQAMAEILEKIVMVKDINLLFMNIIVLAVVPAVVEEFYFRGSLQTIFYKIFKNPHISIWVTAIIFSAIHLQFYGFLPRMLLGVIFGYSLYWTGNIWIAVFGHFVNNLAVTLIAYYYVLEGKSFQELQTSEPYQLWIYILSAILLIAIGYYWYTKRQTNKLTYE